MGDVKEYYYMRLKENFFDEESLKIIEGIPGDGIYYEVILLKLYLRSLRTNGKLMYRDRIPYNIQMLSAVTNQPESMVRSAMELFENMGLIERLDNGALYMMDIQNYIGKSSDEADRKREYRAQIEEEKKLQIEQKTDKCQTNVGQMSRQMSDKCPDKCRTNVGQVSDKSPLEIRDKSIDILDISKDISCANLKKKSGENDIASDEAVAAEQQQSKSKRAAGIDYEEFRNKFNSICKSFEPVSQLTDSRRTKIRARLKSFTKEQIFLAFEKAEQSDFLSGRDGKWSNCDFNWLMKNDDNLIKILEGNYDNKRNKGKSRIEINPEQREGYVDVIFGDV